MLVYKTGNLIVNVYLIKVERETTVQRGAVMLRKDIQDFYFKAVDVLFDDGFCPKMSNRNIELLSNCKNASAEDCKECISEYIMKAACADTEMMDLILGE